MIKLFIGPIIKYGLKFINKELKESRMNSKSLILTNPILVTGCAGFIGMAVTLKLLTEGECVIGVDNINDYYNPQLKEDRLHEIGKHPQASNFLFHRIDISDREAMAKLWEEYHPKRVIHLAAQAGVRHSLQDPFAYLHSNITGFLVILELCRHQDDFEHLVYASSSSVYGDNPLSESGFEESENTTLPLSFYGATKASNELMAQSYAHLYNINMTGLRFFTVYGPWGRPDMAYYKFTQEIVKGNAIEVYNQEKMIRDFTYIDDVVDGILGALNRDVTATTDAHHAIYNLGNNRPERLSTLIELIEETLGKRAIIKMLPTQPGDGIATCANIDLARRDLDYVPKVKLREGIEKFVEWHRRYEANLSPLRVSNNPAFPEYSKVIFWDYKRRDNTDYNFQILETMISALKSSPQPKYFYKPIFLIMVSIIECTLYDFFLKIQEHKYEKIPNLSEEEKEGIQNTNIPNQLGSFNDICKKYQFLGRETEIYEKIKIISNTRNRIHIQNIKFHKPSDESHLWNKDILKKCGNILKEVFIIMCEKYPRHENTTNHENPSTSNFPEPWKLL